MDQSRVRGWPCSDDPEIYDGAPVGVQLVARKYEEEKVWAIAKVVDAALKAARSKEESEGTAATQNWSAEERHVENICYIGCVSVEWLVPGMKYLYTYVP